MRRRNFIKSVAHTGTAGFLIPKTALLSNAAMGTFAATAAFTAGSGCSSGNNQTKNSDQVLRSHPLEGVQRQNIKITDIRVRLFSTPIPSEKWWYGCGVELVTEIFTDQGIIGIGGPSNYGGEVEIKKITEELIRPMLVGMNPFDIEYIAAGNSPQGLGGPSWATACAWAGIDVACWDIIGKAVNKPVWQLLATDHEPKTHIEHYASAGTVYDWKKRPEVLIEDALSYKEEGFKSFKFRLGENFEQVMTIDKYIPFLRKLREAVGPEFRLMQESNMRLSLEQCLQLVPVLEELNFTWFEEPMNRWTIDPKKRNTLEGLKETIEGHIKINQAATKILISGGETMHRLEEFAEWILRDVYDIVQPDCNSTGLTEGWRIARLAHLKNKPCVPHNWHGAPTWMSNIQLVAGIPNQYVLESNRNFNPFREGLLTNPIVVKDSYADAPSGPGLGVEIIPDADKKFPYDDMNSWRKMKR
jgi:galactonate dehydratase